MNSNFNIEDTEFEGLKIITPFYVEDNRGFFLKSVEKDIFKSFGLNAEIFEDFESYSTRNVIRGLHFQTRNPQIKIVRAIIGEVMDVVVDLRPNSKTYGKWKSFILSDKNHLALWIPAGFAHGFKALSEQTLMSYKCVGKYEKGFDSGIRWNDETLNISWGVDDPVISSRDAQLQTFEEYIKNPIEF